MAPELQRYYEDRLSMMGDKAWQDLMDDVRQMAEATNRLDGVDDVETLKFRKGELSILNWLLSLKEVSEMSYQTLKEEDEDSA